MIAKHAFRSIQPLRSSTRHYATQGSSSSGSNTAIYGGLAVAALGGGYYYYRQTGAKPSPAPAQSPAPAKENSVPLANYPAKPPNSTFLGGDQGWVDLKLESTEQVNHNTKKVRFSLLDKDDVSGLRVTSAILTKYQGPGMDKPLIRPYTPTSDEDTKGHIDFLIKKYPEAPMSTHIHDMKPDQSLAFKGPIEKYPWQPNKHEHIALIAGGTGITPMYQLTRAIFKNPEDKTKVTLVFGNVKEEDILLKHEFEELENNYPQRFRAFYLLDQPPESWMQGTGYITKEVLKTVLPEPKSKNIKLFVCGPPGLYKAVSGTKTSPSDQGELSGYLKDLGYSKDQVYKF